MKIKLMIVVLGLLYINGCTNQTHMTPAENDTFVKPSSTKKYAFNSTMRSVARSIRRDKNYKKMSLDTPAKKAWFKQLMYRLWDRQITRRDFISEGLSKYPNNNYEFNFVAHGFQLRS